MRIDDRSKEHNAQKNEKVLPVANIVLNDGVALNNIYMHEDDEAAKAGGE